MNRTISFRKTIQYIKEDLIAYWEPFWKAYLFIPGFRYTTNHRICYYLSQYKAFFPLFAISRLYMYRLTWKFGIQTAWNKPLPRFFTISHFSGITFLPESCGHHLYLRQGLTVGRSGRGAGRLPRIGSYVEFGANVCVVGDIDIGNNVKIGAGSVVTKSIPDNSVAVGVPAKVIKTLDCIDIQNYDL